MSKQQRKGKDEGCTEESEAGVGVPIKPKKGGDRGQEKKVERELVAV